MFLIDAQRLAFRHYIEAGGKFFGIHSVMGTSEIGPGSNKCLRHFAWHPNSALDLVKMDASHPLAFARPMDKRR
jgi:hypothetical protein